MYGHDCVLEGKRVILVGDGVFGRAGGQGGERRVACVGWLEGLW